ncbi:MAG: 1,4-dihydroxy-2-naphthoate octaprenyltransferase [Dysgonamonadaceae bacterium]|jgi:1,4-dihydroxy-2-naphthoate octaprenyltransferase|nr:1,4-dihydroxy-2-naphthoate octaprenyltransferase [Dysgonamonadaceae bacterium]
MANKSHFKYWIPASRPKTLPASVIPVLVGATLAYHAGGFKWIPTIICFLFALIAQIVSNLFNDYFDFKTGSDQSDRLGPDRAVSKGWIKPEAMLKASVGLIIFACLLGCGLIYYAGWKILWVGIAVSIGAFAYSAGPYPLASNGLGDVCVILFYGIVPVGFTYYVQVLDWPATLTICGAAVGFVITNILVANNFRDREQDKRAGKNTTVVLFGTAFGKWLYLSNGIIAVMICLFFFLYDMKYAALLPVLYLILHIPAWKEMCKIHEGKELNKILGRSSVNTVIFGFLLITGILLS